MRRTFIAITLPIALAGVLPILHACGGRVADDGADTSDAAGAGTGTVTATPDEPDDLSLVVATPGTATVTSKACGARVDACAAMTPPSVEAWAKSIVATCKPKTTYCGNVDFLFEKAEGCSDHVVLWPFFEPAFVACVATRARDQRCGVHDAPIGAFSHVLVTTCD